MCMHEYLNSDAGELDERVTWQGQGTASEHRVHTQLSMVGWHYDQSIAVPLEMKLNRRNSGPSDANIGARQGAEHNGALFVAGTAEHVRALFVTDLKPEQTVRTEVPFVIQCDHGVPFASMPRACWPTA